MEAFDALMGGFAIALQPTTLLWGFVGCFIGTLVGVLPGIGPALTIALLLPLTYHVPATSMFVMFAGIYYGAAYGGSTTSILLNTPGESAAVVTALEGNKMARNGRAGQALATAAIGSFVAGTIGTLALTFFAPLVVDAALAFGPAEYFSLMVLSLVAVSAVLGNSMLRGLVALSLGLLLGMVGIDLQTGHRSHRGCCGPVCRGRSALPGLARARVQRRRSHETLGQPVDEQARLGSLVESLVPWRVLWFPHRRHACGRGRVAHAAVVLHREKTLQAPRRIWPWRDRRCGRA
jgi:hypothetical protein